MKAIGDTWSLLVLTLPSQLMVSEAHSAWQIVPELIIEAESNDNPRLEIDSTLDPEIQDDRWATRLLADVGLQFSTLIPRGEFLVTPSLRSDAYTDPVDRELESTDAFLTSRGSYRWERLSAGYVANLSNERILGAEFLAAQPLDIDVEEPEVIDTVLLGRNERRRRAVVSPYTEIKVNDRATVRLDSRVTGVGYDTDRPTGRTDFMDLSFGAAYVRDLSTRGILAARFFGSSYQADRNHNRTDSKGIELSFSRVLSNTWSFDLTSGIAQHDLEYLDGANMPVVGEDENFTFAVGLRKRAHLSSVNLDLRRHMSPDSFGFLVDRTELRLSAIRQLSPKMQGRLALRAIETRVDQRTTPDSFQYARFEMGLKWTFAELWSLLIGYQYSGRESRAIQNESSANSVSIGFTYRGRSKRSSP